MVTFDFTAFDFSPLVLMVRALAATVLISLALAVAKAVRSRTFKWSQLDGFVGDDLVPALVIVTTEAVGILTVSTEFQVLAIGAAAAFIAARLPGIKDDILALVKPSPTA
jgi:hypothetical protein